MSKWFLIQAVYCITGIGFFVRDMLAKVPMGDAMINAFIWPYAQWMVIKAWVMTAIEPLLNQIPH